MKDPLKGYAEEVKSTTRRVGKPERTAAAEHLRYAREQDYLTDDLYHERASAAEVADTAAQLKALLADLPSVLELTGGEKVPGKVRRMLSGFDFRKPAHFVPVLLFTLVLGLIIAIVPSVIITAMPVSHVVMNAVQAPTIIVGAAVAGISFITLVVRGVIFIDS